MNPVLSAEDHLRAGDPAAALKLLQDAGQPLSQEGFVEQRGFLRSQRRAEASFGFSWLGLLSHQDHHAVKYHCRSMRTG